MRGKPPIKLPKDTKQQAVASLKQYLIDNIDEEAGDLKTDLLLSFVLEELGPTIYNQAITDARAFFEERAADLDGVCYHVEFPSSTKK